MDETLRFILHHGYLVLVAWVFAEQMGLPIPSMPGLLAAGALAGLDRVPGPAGFGTKLATSPMGPPPSAWSRWRIHVY